MVSISRAFALFALLAVPVLVAFLFNNSASGLVSHWLPRPFAVEHHLDMSLYQSILTDPQIQPHVAEAVSLTKGILQQHSLEEVALSFNGGKDCTVLLHLLAAAIASIKPECTKEPLKGMKTFYVDDPYEFEEVRDFMQDMSREYGFELVSLKGSFKEALTDLLSTNPIKYILMGQRRGDPGMKNLQLMAPSDAGYPPFVRVNVVMDWNYKQVWDFLRQYKLPYCVLYDQGYTSLGNKLNTNPHPALARPDGSFKPAWELIDESTERAGRTPSKPGSASAPPTPSASSGPSVPSSPSAISASSASIAKEDETEAPAAPSQAVDDQIAPRIHSAL